MRDPDMREFFNGSNRAKKYNQQMKKDMEKRKPSFKPTVPFPSSTTPKPIWEEPKPPIEVVKSGSYLEWEWMGVTFRPYYAGNLWLNCDASLVYYAFLDRSSNTITKVKRLDVIIDPDGKQYVENYVNKDQKKVYLDDALRTVFHTGLPPVQSPIASIPTASPQYYCNQKNTTILNHEGNEYSFYHDGKFCVSKEGGLACWMGIDWSSKPATFDKITIYNVYTKADGRKYVKVKQPDGFYKEFDMATAVGKTFLKDPPCDDCIIKFKDGNVSNCDADNLYWG